MILILALRKLNCVLFWRGREEEGKNALEYMIEYMNTSPIEHMIGTTSFLLGGHKCIELWVHIKSICYA